MCTRKGHAASVRLLRRQRLRNISSFSNRRIGGKDPPKRADTFVRAAFCLFHAARVEPARIAAGVKRRAALIVHENFIDLAGIFRRELQPQRPKAHAAEHVLLVEQIQLFAVQQDIAARAGILDDGEFLSHAVDEADGAGLAGAGACLLYTSPSPRD